jgi:thioredoxin-dependent peroxiredoxin
MIKFKEGDVVNGLEIQSCKLGKISIDALKEDYVILYFYPKDDTPGCTIEAKDFSLLRDDFAKLNAVVFGISKDDLASHKKFIDKYDLQIDLIHDESDIVEKFGVWVEKSMYGKKYMGIKRSTFFLDKNRKIVKIWDKVKVKDHALTVLGFTKVLALKSKE